MGVMLSISCDDANVQKDLVTSLLGVLDQMVTHYQLTYLSDSLPQSLCRFAICVPMELTSV